MRPRRWRSPPRRSRPKLPWRARAPRPRRRAVKSAAATAAEPVEATEPADAPGATSIEESWPEAPPAPAVEARGESSDEERRQRALDLVVETLEALLAERGDNDVIWGSMVKQTLKRRQPGFNESYYGYRSFNALLEDAQARGLISLTRDDKSGGFKLRLADRVE